MDLSEKENLVIIIISTVQVIYTRRSVHPNPIHKHNGASSVFDVLSVILCPFQTSNKYFQVYETKSVLQVCSSN